MDILYTLNYLIFSAFLTLLVLEVGVALLSLVSYSYYTEKLKGYITPIWEINGTFAIFYLVNFEVTYPKLLPIVGAAYILPALLAGMFFILRNAFITYSAHAKDKAESRKYIRIYTLATLIVAILAISIFDSAVSGIGISVSTASVDIVTLLLNPYNTMMFAAIVLIAFFVASMFFGVKKELMRLSLVGLALGVAFFIAANYLYVPYIISNISGYYYLAVISAVLLMLGLLLGRINRNASRFLVLVWFVVSLNFFGAIQYPYMFGGMQNVSNYMNNAAIAGPASLITAVGGTLLALALLYFIKISYLDRKRHKGY